MNIQIKKEFRVHDATDPALAVHAIYNIARLLSEAVSNKQEFSVEIIVADRQTGEIDGWAVYEPGEAFEVHIKGQPTKPGETFQVQPTRKKK